jgi:predicted MPP superfamily phosphohydrolase
MQRELIEKLERRLGRVYVQQRLGIERDHEETFGYQIDSPIREQYLDNSSGEKFHFNTLHREMRAATQGHREYWLSTSVHPADRYSVRSLMRLSLRLAGLYARGNRNAERIVIRRNDVQLRGLPVRFEGFTILQLSDLHADINPGAMRRLVELLNQVTYDICVVTGDIRGETFGSFDAALESLAHVRTHINQPVYGVLGNHDSIRMVPALENMGIRMLMNECETIEYGDQRIHLAGIDDAHLYGTHNIEKAAWEIPAGECAILLSHTPEVYRQAAHAGFGLMLSGHTHGGQICLPGSIPLTLFSVLPRRMGAGPWRYGPMAGYTSTGVGSCLVPVRFNCPPEITLHYLHCG